MPIHVICDKTGTTEVYRSIRELYSLYDRIIKQSPQASIAFNMLDEAGKTLGSSELHKLVNIVELSIRSANTDTQKKISEFLGVAIQSNIISLESKRKKVTNPKKPISGR